MDYITALQWQLLTFKRNPTPEAYDEMKRIMMAFIASRVNSIDNSPQAESSAKALLPGLKRVMLEMRLANFIVNPSDAAYQRLLTDMEGYQKQYHRPKGGVMSYEF